MLKLSITSNLQRLHFSLSQDGRLYLGPGYWRHESLDTDYEECINNQKSCQEETTILGYKQCTDGYLGALCEACDSFKFHSAIKYRRVERALCAPCSNTNANLFIYLA